MTTTVEPTSTRVPGDGFWSVTTARLVSSGAPPLTSSFSFAFATSGWASESGCFNRSGTTVTLSGTMTSRGAVLLAVGAWTTTVTVVPARTRVLGSGFCSTTTTLVGSAGGPPLTCSRRRASVMTF